MGAVFTDGSHSSYIPYNCRIFAVHYQCNCKSNCSFLSNLLKTIYLWNTVEKAKVLAQEMKLPKNVY